MTKRKPVIRMPGFGPARLSLLGVGDRGANRALFSAPSQSQLMLNKSCSTGFRRKKLRILACTIKAGMHDGKCIYHLTGDRWYAKMKMDKPDRRWFCSEQEAEAAGCRVPKQLTLEVV